MTTAAARAFRSMSTKEGQFTLLLDENFDILWHSESLTSMLGWTDLRGRNGTEFVHPDDLELVLETMFKANQDHDPLNQLDPIHRPESADIRVLDHAGAWHAFETTTHNHLDKPEINAVLCTCEVIRDRSDVATSIELLGTGADVRAVLPVIARLAGRSMGAETRVAIAWRQGEHTHVVGAADEVPLDFRLANASALVWSLGLTEPLTITDLTDGRLAGLGTVAENAGFRAAYLVPIEAPAGQEIIGAMIAWGRSTIEFQIPRQSPVHVALRLAALAIADSHTKRELRWAASHDPLTGLMNRAEFARRLHDAADSDLVLLLYIDLDDFKPINDTYGHPVGDAVLIEVGRRITSVIGPYDAVGRLGGDEFAVVCIGTDDPLYGRVVADRIVEAISVPMIHNGLHLRVGASVGVAAGVQPLIPAILVQRADQALYTAKNTGKNTVCLAS
jgi:diguanylate cyclase (GGDEF)-like protein